MGEFWGMKSRPFPLRKMHIFFFFENLWRTKKPVAWLNYLKTRLQLGSLFLPQQPTSKWSRKEPNPEEASGAADPGPMSLVAYDASSDEEDAGEPPVAPAPQPAPIGPEPRPPSPSTSVGAAPRPTLPPPAASQ